mmetsp:Transcript_2068/g.3656  ORF Transcript_2068/g.3656 Transcript_2068/m.3656 type:complete len:191 (+) Transcript_2068:143-715(+)
MEKDWMIGAPVCIKVSGSDQVLEGIVFTFDTDLNCVVLQCASTTNKVDRAMDFHVIKASSILEVTASTSAATDLPVTSSPLPDLSWDKLREREKASILRLREDQREKGIGISDRGAEIFRALSKTLPCHWGSSDNIIILDTLRLPPPYRPEDLRAIENDTSALNRVKLVLEKERAKIYSAPIESSANTTP